MALTPAERQRRRRERLRQERESRTVTEAERLRRAKEILESPLPEDEALYEEAMKVLRVMALDPTTHEGSRVGACKTILKHALPVVPKTPTKSSNRAEAPSSPQPASQVAPVAPRSLEDELQ